MALRRSNRDTIPGVRPRGLTLVELVLVLAVIVVIAGLALPALSGFLRVGRMTSAADRLRTLMSEARYYAMSTGQTYSLRQPTEDSLEIGPAADALDENEISGSKSPPVKSATLPDGVRIDSLMQTGGDARTPGSDGRSVQVGVAGQATGEPMAYFYPDGTSSTIDVALIDDKGHGKIVTLRGLTGATLVREREDGANAVNPYTSARGGK
ncbi:MAG: prepilin-type N-terminal cleavage/methylation domain-containing protein [Pirellulales bacterium]